MNSSSKKIGLRIVAVASVLILVLAGLIIMFSDRGNLLVIQVVPSDSIVKLDSRLVKQGKIRTKPGVHIIDVSRAGFSPQSKSVSVADKGTSYAGIGLLPNSDTTIDWYKNHPADQQVYELITGKYVESDSTSQIKNTPLIKALPFIDLYYRIDYGQSKINASDVSAVAIYITYYSQSGKNDALDWLKFKGINTDKIEIVYIDKVSGS